MNPPSPVTGVVPPRPAPPASAVSPRETEAGASVQAGARPEGPRPRWLRAPLRFGRDLLGAYAGVYFGQRWSIGLLLLLATFVIPRHGLLGLLGGVSAAGLAGVLGLDAGGQRSYYALNGLLVGLALGLFYKLSLPLVLLLAVAVAVAVALAAAARSLTELYLGVPALSLPFVLATWVALLAARRFTGLEFTLDPIVAGQLGAGWLPAAVELFLRSLSAALFQLSVPAGLILFTALVLSSRWAAVLAVLGYVAGTLTYTALGGLPGDLGQEFIGFNFILAAIAVGGVYVTLSPGSLGLAALAGVLAAGISAALLSLLQPLGLPPLALPFILAVHALLFTLGRRTRAGGLALVQGVPSSPEGNLLAVLERQGRYPPAGRPLVYLPVMGRWWVSQGVDGQHTHRGLWRHAWDLEVRDSEGRLFADAGLRHEDYFCYGLPVLAPGDGQVVHAVGHLADTPIGAVDVGNNWGNCVVLWHGGTVYSLLAHLQKGSLSVVVGQQVVAGQAVGRVGSSGRAPRPHLHFHVQRSPLPGAPTTEASLLHYLEHGRRGAPLYRTHGQPAQGDEISALALSETRREALSLTLGRSWSWTGRIGTRTVQERWSSDIGLLGTRHLHATPTGATLEVFSDRGYTTVVRYRGGGRGLLHLLWLGVPRVPHNDEDLRWHDELLPGAALLAPARLLYELALPFGRLAVLQTRSRFDHHATGIVVETEVRAVGPLARFTRPLPDRVRVHYSPQQGPLRIEAFRADALWAEAELEPSGGAP